MNAYTAAVLIVLILIAFLSFICWIGYKQGQQ